MKRAVDREAFLLGVRLLRDQIEDWGAYPFSIPAIRSLEELVLDDHVTFLIGDNGSAWRLREIAATAPTAHVGTSTASTSALTTAHIGTRIEHRIDLRDDHRPRGHASSTTAHVGTSEQAPAMAERPTSLVRGPAEPRAQRGRPLARPRERAGAVTSATS